MIGKVVFFKIPKVISGVGKDAVKVIGCAPVRFSDPVTKRPITISVGLMENGSSGMASMLIGNYHMTEDWDFQMNRKEFIIKTPEDKGEPICMQLDWLSGRGQPATPQKS